LLAHDELRNVTVRGAVFGLYISEPDIRYTMHQSRVAAPL